MELSYTEDILRNSKYEKYTEEEIQFILSYKHKGKTADEWIAESNNSSGPDETGNPAWYQFLSNAEDTVTLAKLKLEKYF